MEYENLITSQYQLSSRLMDHLAYHIQEVEGATSLINSLYTYFDIDNAVGYHLDVIGHIVGQERRVTFQPTDGSSPILDDDTYRILLKARIVQNHWDGLLSSLQSVWQLIFPGGVIVVIDTQLMSATINLAGSFSQIIIDLINNGMIVPRPQGVLYVYDFGDLPYFGFDYDSNFVSGLDIGKFA